MYLKITNCKYILNFLKIHCFLETFLKFSVFYPLLFKINQMYIFCNQMYLKITNCKYIKYICIY